MMFTPRPFTAQEVAALDAESPASRSAWQLATRPKAPCPDRSALLISQATAEVLEHMAEVSVVLRAALRGDGWEV